MRRATRWLLVVPIALAVNAAAEDGGKTLRVSKPEALAAAVAKAQPGETIVLADGTYPDAMLNLRGAGAEGKPVTVRAETPGKVKFTGRSGLELRGEWLAVDGLVWEECTTSPVTLRDTRHCRVTGCAVVRCNPPDGARIHWLRVAGAAAEDNRIDHCYTDGKTKDGVVLVVDGDQGKMPQRTRIDHNHFRNVVRAVQNGMETIRVGTSTYGQVDSHTLVEFNRFEKCSGDAEIISSKSCANVYRYNTFLECEGALVMRHGHRSTIEGNWFFGAGTPRSAGIRVHGSDHRVFNNYLSGLGQFSLSLPAGQSKFVPTGHEPNVRCVAAYNTIVDPVGPAILLGADQSTLRDTLPADAQLLNNLVVSSRGKLVEDLGTGSVRWAGNLFFARPGAEAGKLPRQGVTLADPRLVESPDGIWRLVEGSPALGAAVPTPFAIPEDLDGQPRPAKADIGADQRSGASVLRHPLRPQDVGPEWMRKAGGH